MRRAVARTFEEVARALSNSVVLLDVDGTLLPDGAERVSPETIQAAAALAEMNEVYLVSNGENRSRVEGFSSVLGIPIAPIGVPAGKPSSRAVTGIESSGRRLVVVGDKYLTDGLFARNLGAEFMLVERKRDGNEKLAVKVIYFMDRVVSWVV